MTQVKRTFESFCLIQNNVSANLLHFQVVMLVGGRMRVGHVLLNSCKFL